VAKRRFEVGEPMRTIYQSTILAKVADLFDTVHTVAAATHLIEGFWTGLIGP
jgi:hypothetical protein